MAAVDYRIWQLQDYDLPHIRRMIDLAAPAAVNRIQLSHNIAMTAEAVLSKPALATDINTICDWARKKGVHIDMWTHELSGLPKELLRDGKPDLDDPAIWQFIRDKYNRLFYLCPGIRGLVLTMAETSVKIYDTSSVATSMPAAARVTKLVDEMAQVCRSFGKDLFVRTFSYEPEELKYIQQGIKATESDFIVMTKCVPHDWQPFYPFNPAIGDVGGKRQVVEFDLGHEFTGLSRIPYIMIDYFKRHWDHDLSKGVCGAVLRLERFAWWSVDTPNQPNVDVCTKLLSDPSADPHQLYKDWLAERYGSRAVEPLFAAFSRTQQIVDLGYFVLGFWVTNHSLIPSYDYATKSLRERTSAKWNPSTKPIEQALYHPTWETVAKIDAEKDRALALVDQSLADLDRAKPCLKADDYTELHDYFDRARSMVIVWKAAMDVIFGITICRSSHLPEDRERLLKAADELERLTDQHKQQLLAMTSDHNGNRHQNLDASTGLVKLARETAQQA